MPRESAPRRRLLAAPERAASILTAAARVFARQGYAATTVEQVAAEAGVSKLIVYRHFNSKRELYQAILDQVHARLQAVETPAEPGVDAATATLAGTFAVARELPDAYRLLHLYAAHEPEFAEHVAQTQRAGLDRLIRMIGPEVDAGFRDWLARLMSQTVDAAFLDWLDHGDPARDPEMVRRVAYLLGAMLGAMR